MNRPSAHLTVLIDDRADPVVIKVDGDLDSYSAGRVREAFSDATGQPTIIIDIRGVPFLDSAGLGALVGGIRRIREAGGEVAVCCTHTGVRRLLGTIGFDRIVPVTQSPAEATAALVSEGAESLVRALRDDDHSMQSV